MSAAGTSTVSLAHADQWARCRHEDTALTEQGAVELTWDDPSDPDCPDTGQPAAGLAFDRWCRGYRSRPDLGRVDVAAPGAQPAKSQRRGTFVVPRGIAVDEGQRLYVAESCGEAVSVIDLWAERLLRRIPVGGAAMPHRQPVDVAAACCRALVLCDRPVGLVVLRGRRAAQSGPPLRRPRCARRLHPSRVAVSGGRVLVLWTSRHDDRAVIATPEGDLAALTRGATDIELVTADVVVVARQPGQSFLRFRRGPSVWSRLHALKAPGYDGAAIALAPDGRLAYTSAKGWSFTSGDASRHVTEGRLVTYRLDSGRYRNRWGRVFLDACLPQGTAVRFQFLTSDADDVDDPLEPARAGRGDVPVRHGELTPTLPSRSAVAHLEPPTGLHRRSEGREWPWAQIGADDDFETYEAPVAAPPGRYLWVVLSLTGTATVSPRVRALRVERRGHRLLDQLPRVLAPTEPEADFLHRLLTPPEAVLRDLDARAAARDVLVSPDATPQEALAWLGSFVGLVLDRRWPLAARRALVAQAFDLFALRGTLSCLERILALYVGRPVHVLENWRLRGLGGGVLGDPGPGPAAPAVLGALRSGGQLGKFTVGGTVPGRTGYSATAHRFTILVPVNLDAERRDVVRSIAESHKPAHTLFTICEAGEGMRVGHGTRIELTTVVGPGSGWSDATVGDSPLGTDALVGRPSVGARVGQTTRVEGVRVG